MGRRTHSGISSLCPSTLSLCNRLINQLYFRVNYVCCAQCFKSVLAKDPKTLKVSIGLLLILRNVYNMKINHTNGINVRRGGKERKWFHLLFKKRLYLRGSLWFSMTSLTYVSEEVCEEALSSWVLFPDLCMPPPVISNQRKLWWQASIHRLILPHSSYVTVMYTVCLNQSVSHTLSFQAEITILLMFVPVVEGSVYV